MTLNAWAVAVDDADRGYAPHGITQHQFINRIRSLHCLEERDLEGLSEHQIRRFMEAPERFLMTAGDYDAAIVFRAVEARQEVKKPLPATCRWPDCDCGFPERECQAPPVLSILSVAREQAMQLNQVLRYLNEIVPDVVGVHARDTEGHLTITTERPVPESMQARFREFVSDWRTVEFKYRAALPQA